MRNTYPLDETAQRLLELAVQAWKRYHQARAALQRHGLTYKLDGRPVARPEVAIEKDSRAAFQRVLSQLGLEHAAPEE